jgi:hypothetical protein
MAGRNDNNCKRIYVWNSPSENNGGDLVCVSASEAYPLSTSEGSSHCTMLFGGGDARGLAHDIREASDKGWEVILGQNPQGRKMPLKPKDRKWFVGFAEGK